MMDRSRSTELVSRCIDGEPSAWARFIQIYTPLVINVLRTSSLTAEERADVLQEVWLKAHSHLSSIDDPRRVPGWLSVVARRELISYAKRARRLHPCGDSSSMDGLAAERPIDEVVMAKLEGEALRSAVGRLRDRERDLVTLLLAEPPLSYDEIGNRLGIPRGSIGPNRARCLARLRTLLEPDHPELEPTAR